tara:strand:+ start:15362 stop:16015 length:654 start_codon:yes stop_codon:yes gene_type:complete
MTNYPKIKFCGLINNKDIQSALNLKISFIGLIFVKNTPRYINFKDAKKIIDKFKNKVKFVGVFLDNSDEYIKEGVKCGIDLIQLHGNESPLRCKEIKNIFRLPIIKAIPVLEEKDISVMEKYNDYCDMFLFDTKINTDKKYNGGTGKSFDWEIIKNNKVWIDKFKPWILSGGLSSKNIKKALEMLRPKYIDVSSGIEYSLGKKSKKSMEAFILNMKS